MMLFIRIFSAPMLYLDPGSGSFLIQLLMAAALGIGVAVKMYWSKIKQLFRGKHSDSSEIDSDNDEE